MPAWLYKVRPTFQGGSESELQSSAAFSSSLPPFDLSLWNPTSPVLGKAQGQYSEEDVERVGRAVELGVSWRAK